MQHKYLPISSGAATPAGGAGTPAGAGTPVRGATPVRSVGVTSAASHRSSWKCAAISFSRAFLHNAAILVLVWTLGYFRFSFLWVAIVLLFFFVRRREKLGMSIFSALQRLIKR